MPLIFVTFCLVSIPYFENVQDCRWAVSWQVTLCLVTGVEEEMYQDAGDNILHILPDTRTQWHHLTTSSNWSPDLPLGCQQMHLTVCIIVIHSICSPKPVDNFSVLDIYSHLTFEHVFKPLQNWKRLATLKWILNLVFRSNKFRLPVATYLYFCVYGTLM